MTLMREKLNGDVDEVDEEGVGYGDDDGVAEKNQVLKISTFSLSFLPLSFEQL